MGLFKFQAPPYQVNQLKERNTQQIILTYRDLIEQ